MQNVHSQNMFVTFQVQKELSFESIEGLEGLRTAVDQFIQIVNR